MIEQFPIVPPTIIEQDLDYKALQAFDATSIIKQGQWTSRYEYTHDFLDQYLDFSNVGLKASGFFHYDARMCCESLNSPSPIRSWYNPKFKVGLTNCDMAKGDMKVALALRKYIASQFRPTSALALYKMFNAKNIFDPCMGWGDRLVAFLTSDAESYTGLDVNPHLFLGYERQINLANTNKDIDLVFERAEVYNDPTKKFDFIFTSPPYYDIERYEGMWQSHSKYKKFNDWMEKFLFKMVENSWDMLEVGGHMAINISDVYSHHTVNKICDTMVDHILTLDDAKYIGAIGYRMRKRPNSKAVGNIFSEPIWIFKKE